MSKVVLPKDIDYRLTKIEERETFTWMLRSFTSLKEITLNPDAEYIRKACENQVGMLKKVVESLYVGHEPEMTPEDKVLKEFQRWQHEQQRLMDRSPPGCAMDKDDFALYMEFQHFKNATETILEKLEVKIDGINNRKGEED